MCMSGEKIASCERIIQVERGDKKEVTYVRAYDQFEGGPGEYLAIIESKISQFNDQWYCDTMICIPNKKQYSKKNL